MSIEDAVGFVAELLGAIGLPESDALICAEHLVAAEARGYPGHGLRRIAGIADLASRLNQRSKNAVRAEAPGFVLFNAEGRLGIPAVHEAALTAAARLADTPAVVFGVVGYVGTTGSLAVLGGALAERGVVSILMCSSEAAVAPHGSTRAVLGTNPISITVPGHPTTFCADLATSAWSYGAIRAAADAGRPLPKGVVQTRTGEASTNPDDLQDGSMLPFAGHKGYALGLAIELLCGPLLGAKAGRSAAPGGDGFLGILMRSDAARPAADVKRDAQALFEEILAGPPVDPATPIRIPGDKASRAHQTATHIEVPAELMARLRKFRPRAATDPISNNRAGQ
ncbi:Ldh family oxidoreductase [Mesorhizobium sp. BHbdii]